MKVLLFAGLAEAAGSPAIEVGVSLPIRVDELKQEVAAKHPAAKELLTSCFAAINQEYAADDAYVREGDEVAFIPPVSGG
jgi:molybdopterin converting factor subunit 1